MYYKLYGQQGSGQINGVHACKHVEWNRSEYEEGIVPDICKILLI